VKTEIELKGRKKIKKTKTVEKVPGKKVESVSSKVTVKKKKHDKEFSTDDIDEAIFLGTRIFVLSQFYCDGRGNDIRRHGARIVADYKLPKRPLATSFKWSDKFVEFKKSILKDGFDPEHLQRVTEFNLLHPDSFQTLTDEEKR